MAIIATNEVVTTLPEPVVTTLPDSVVVLRGFNGSVVYLVGTTHLNNDREEDVTQLINAIRPDTVLLELCGSRQSMLSINESNIGNMPNFASELKGHIKNLGFVQGIIYKLVLYLSSNNSPGENNIGHLEGGEFRIAVKEAGKYNSQIYLADRPIYITIKRVISKLSWLKCIKLIVKLLTTNINLLKREVELFNARDFQATTIVADYPELKDVIIDERDKYLTYNLQLFAGIDVDVNGELVNLLNSGNRPQRVVGIVRIATISGIQNCWQIMCDKDVSEIAKLPPQSRSTKIIKIVIKVSSCGLLLWGISKIPGVKSLSNLAYNAIAIEFVRGRFIK